MQAPGRPDEDVRGGFKHGGWAISYSDQVLGSAAAESMSKTRALLLGRRTYEDFYRVWPERADNPFTEVLNKTQKYVVSRTLKEPGRLEIESADFGQLTGNSVGGLLDLDQNGVIVISGNTVNGNVKYGTNGWCGTGNNKITGSTSGSCVGNVVVDVLNTGSTTVQLTAVYLSNTPLAGSLSWQLVSGKPVQCGNVQASSCAILPVIIPVHEMARITLGWTPPATVYPLPWNYIYSTFISSRMNFVDGYLYFSSGLGLPTQSRVETRVCPPCV